MPHSAAKDHAKDHAEDRCQDKWQSDPRVLRAVSIGQKPPPKKVGRKKPLVGLRLEYGPAIERPISNVQLGEICLRLEVPGARCPVRARAGVPKGVDGAPNSGNYRQFGPGQAFWLGMVLKLKAIGIQTPLAAKLANDAEESLRAVTHNLGWDWRLRPLAGWFDTEHQYYVEIGDLKPIRLVTGANASRLELEDFPDMHS